MVNTFIPLVLPHYFGIAFFIFLLRQFYLSIPNDYLDAARIDGASEIRIWWRIMIPLSKPAILVVIILSFQHAWDDFIQPLIYLQDENLQTLSLGLYRFRALPGQGSIVNEMMAASVMLTVPQILVFLFFQKQIMDGANYSGVKG
jgi:multiple sugar transport system permease protein